MAWQVGGYRHREIQEVAGGATYTNVNKHLTRARAKLRAFAAQADAENGEPPAREPRGR